MFGPYRLDLGTRELTRGSEAVALTTGEFGLLKVLASHPRQPLAREKLMLLARGRDHDVFDRAIDVQVSRLRKLIEANPSSPRYIQTVWGFGYVFVPDQAPDAASTSREGWHLTLWPRSLFGRLALLLLLVILISQATAIFLFRQDRAALLSRQFGDTKIVQLKALRAGLAAADPKSTAAALARFGEAYQARIVPDDGSRRRRRTAAKPVLVELLERLKSELGPETDLRIQPRLQLLWIKLQAGENAYWAGFQLPPRPADEVQSRALGWSLIALAVLLTSAYFFARYLARPLRQLNDAVAHVGEGKLPPPLPETGPSEIASLNRGFNQMLAKLRQADEDRALLLAGVSHDLRTPLARLAARHRGRCQRCFDARRNDFRHRRDGQDHRSVSRICARQPPGTAGDAGTQ